MHLTSGLVWLSGRRNEANDGVNGNGHASIGYVYIAIASKERELHDLQKSHPI